MAFWDGTVSTNFLTAGNWDTGSVPGSGEAAVFDNIGAGLNLDPTLFSGNSASILSLNMSARTFSVQGSLTVLDFANLTSSGILSIAAGGAVTVGGSGVFVDGGALNNFGGLNSAVQITNGGWSPMVARSTGP